jgi:hypothetical protein
LGINQANARTALGITSQGDLIWIMAAQKLNSSGNSGLSFSLEFRLNVYLSGDR